MKKKHMGVAKNTNESKAERALAELRKKRKTHKKYTGIREVGFHRTHHEKEEIPYGETAF